ncbi:hypothetical protein D0Z07_6984 [Hyphodiscus hymeniophilus]|uniref:BTB domain-containing protein n=1 Tax=Hyphodiscus hymeniophilus TaxID=353542 RepID=A0A9P7AV48_9HELO|nr:hypothetical protein D0Z07_6984 [Hyphodiscus hymeniophilus]
MAFAAGKVTFAEDLGLEIVDILVGPEKKRYVVHKRLLTAQSDYFSKALTGNFMEAEENSIQLKEEDPATVSLLIAWLYLGAIPSTEKPFSPFATSILPFTRAIELPSSVNGTVYQYAPTNIQIPVGARPAETESFQHICFQSHYQIFSPEELRLADYRLGRKYQHDGHALPTLTIPPSLVTSAPPTAVAPPRQPWVGAGLFSNLGSGSSFLTRSISQNAASSNTGSNLFGGGSLSSLAISQTATSQNTGSQFSGLTLATVPLQASNLSLFGRAGSTAYKTSSALSGNQPSSSNRNGPFIQQNMFAGRYGSIAPSTNSNPAGITLTTQTQGYFGNTNGSPASGSSVGGASSSMQVATPVSSLFGPLPTSQPQTSAFNGSLSSQPQNGGLFGNSSSQPRHATAAASQPQVGGLFGSASTTGGSGLSGRAAPPPSAPNSSPYGQPFATAFGTQSRTGDATPSLPPGVVMTIITPKKRNPGDFGYHFSIKAEKSPGNFIPGIPRAKPQDRYFLDMEKHQLALLNLTILAETFCWPKLFNVAIDAYIRGENRLQRPIGIDVIDRIYARTHEQSTLRAYALDNLSQIKLEGVEDLTPYMDMAHKHSDFLADLLSKVLGSSSPEDVTEKTIHNYMFRNESEEEEL